MLDDIVEWYHRAGIILIYRPNEAALRLVVKSRRV